MRNAQTSTPFITLLQENIKTGAVKGAQGGAVFLGLVSMLALSPEVGVPVGYVLGSMLGGAAGFPLALTAYVTRRYIDADNVSAAIAKIKDTKIQRFIILSILCEDKGGVSLSSDALNETLQGDYSTERKWHALVQYINEKNADGIYVNNGKKLFNTIARCVKKFGSQNTDTKDAQRLDEHSEVVTADDADRLDERTEVVNPVVTEVVNPTVVAHLKKMKEYVEGKNFDTEGRGAFSRKTPEGIKRLRECFEGLTLETLTPHQANMLLATLQTIANTRLNKHKMFRDQQTDFLYRKISTSCQPESPAFQH